MSTIVIASAFTINGGNDPAVGLALADINLYLYAIHKTTGARTEIWNGTQHPTAEVANVGAYIRLYTAANVDTYDYIAGADYTGLAVLDADWVLGSLSEDNAAIWSYATRTLTMSAAAALAALTGSTINILRGDTWSVSLTGLGSVADYATLDFCIKVKKEHPDTSAIIRVRRNLAGGGSGLVRLNGASTTAAYGSITVDDPVAGDITLWLAPAATKELVPRDNLYYDVQKITAAGVVTTMTEAIANVHGDVTRLTA